MADAMRSCTGKVVIIGMGKSGHVANKMAATLSSLGTCSISLHPGECMHGDLGMIQKQDAVILISYSGESDEIVRIIPGLKIIGAKLMGITCNCLLYTSSRRRSPPCPSPRRPGHASPRTGSCARAGRA